MGSGRGLGKPRKGVAWREIHRNKRGARTYTLFPLLRGKLRARKPVHEDDLPARHVLVHELAPARRAFGGLQGEQPLRFAVEEFQRAGDHARIIERQGVALVQQGADVGREAITALAHELADEDVVHLERLAGRRVGLGLAEPLAQGGLAGAGRAKDEDDRQ